MQGLSVNSIIVGSGLVTTTGNNIYVNGVAVSGSSSSGNFVTPSQTGAFLTSGYGVSVLNPITGFTTGSPTTGLGTLVSGVLTISGAGNISLAYSGQTITISGTTGNFVLTSQTGAFLTSANAGGVQSINVTGLTTSGALTFTGIGGLLITSSGQTITFSGGGAANTGSLATAANLASTGAFLQSEIVIISGTTGSFVTTSQTGSFITNIINPLTGVSGSSGAVGAYTIASGTVGNSISFRIISGSTGINLSTTSGNDRVIIQTTGIVFTSQTGNFVTTSQTGGFLDNSDATSFIIGGNTISGAVTFSGAGSVTVTNVGNTVQISGASSTGGAAGTGINFGVPAWGYLSWASTVTWTGVSGIFEDRRIINSTGAFTLALSGMFNGWAGSLEIYQSGSGAWGVTLPSNTKVINGGSGAVVLSTGISGARDILGFEYIDNALFCAYGNLFN